MWPKKKKIQGYKAYIKANRKRKKAKNRKKQGSFCKARLFKNRFFWLGLGGMLTLAGFVYFSFFSPVFQLALIEVGGAHLVSASEVENIARENAFRRFLFFPTQSIFLFPSGDTRQVILDEFLPVEEVVVKRRFPRKLEVKVQEKRPEVLLCQEKKAECFFVDKEGLAFFAKEKKEDLHLPVVYIEDTAAIGLGAVVLEKETIKSITNLNKGLKDYQRFDIKNFSLSPPQITLKTEQNWDIYFSQDKDLKTQKEDLILLLEKEIFFRQESEENRFSVAAQTNEALFREIKYIDLRFDKIFYKYKD